MKKQTQLTGLWALIFLTLVLLGLLDVIERMATIVL